MENTTQENEIFVGREEEIALFRKCFEAILPENQGKEEYKNCPRILSFYGESGVGKTRLVEYLVDVSKKNHNNPISIQINFKETDILHILRQEDSQSEFIKYFFLSLQKAFYFGLENDINDLPELYLAIGNWAEKLASLSENKPIILIIDNFNFPSVYYQVLVECFFRSLYNHPLIRHKINIITLITTQNNIIDYFPVTKIIEVHLKPFSFEESKTFLNGFFSQFSDEYLQKIYAYTKGKPEQLQFLVNLVKEKKISAEAVLNELIRNEGKVLSDLKFALEESENLEHKVIAVMTHNLNNKFGGLRNDFDSLKKIVERGIKDELADEVLNDFYRKLDEATNTFNNTYRILEKRNIAPQKTNIFEFLNELKVDYIKKNFSIEVNTENTHIEAEIDRGALKDAFENLINNAEKHGFKDDTKRYKIVFSLSEFKKNEVEFIRILYQNNGKAFSKGFSFEDYRRLAGKSANSTGAGIGGYWIKKVIDLHKGEWNALHLHDNLLIFPIEMEFILPKKQVKA